jgi:hypothetical protein
MLPAYAYFAIITLGVIAVFLGIAFFREPERPARWFRSLTIVVFGKSLADRQPFTRWAFATWVPIGLALVVVGVLGILTRSP